MKLSHLLIYLFLATLSASQYMTNPTRTSTVATLCASFPDRYSIVSQQSKAEVEQYNNAMKISFSQSGNDIMVSLFKSGNPMNIINDFPKLKIEFGIFVGIFLLGFLIIFITIPYVGCCCCCPHCCPLSKCCRRQKDEPYSNAQLIWPAVVLLILLTFILVGGAIGISKAKDIKTTIDAVGCSMAIGIDDTINGNVTQDGKYFIGVQTLSNKIGDIKNNAINIVNNFSSVTSEINNADTAYLTLKDAISSIPTGAPDGKVAAFTYATPFISAAASGSIPSLLPDALGSSNSGDSSSAIYSTLSALKAIQDGLNQIKTTTDNVKTAFSDPSFSSSFDSAQSSLGSIVSSLNSIDSMFSSTIASFGPVLPLVIMVVTAVFASFIGLAVLAAIPTLFLLIGKWYKCRYFLYFTCCIFFYVTLITLMLACVMSALLPAIYFACDFTTYTISSSANFKSNFGSSLSGAADLISKCLPGQSGQILQSSVLGSVTSSIADFRSSIQSYNKFDVAQVLASIDSAWATTNNLVNGFYYGTRYDFSSSSQVDELKKLSSPSNHGSCAAPLFASDSWIPTTKSPMPISCKVSPANLADGVKCGAAADVQAGTNGCFGCMDTFQIHLARGASLATQLGSRYSGGGCAAFISQLSNTLTNYYQVKKVQYSPIKTRTDSVDSTSIPAYKSSITNVGSTFTNVLTQLDGTLNSVIDLKYGLIAGLNCALLGEDINLINNALCSHTFRLIYLYRVAFGMASICLLLSLYCMVYTGVRYYKHGEWSQQGNNTDLQKHGQGGPGHIYMQQTQQNLADQQPAQGNQNNLAIPNGMNPHQLLPPISNDHLNSPAYRNSDPRRIQLNRYPSYN